MNSSYVQIFKFTTATRTGQDNLAAFTYAVTDWVHLEMDFYAGQEAHLALKAGTGPGMSERLPKYHIHIASMLRRT